MSYACTVCNEIHEEWPALGYIAPDPYAALDEAERARYRAECDSDFCIIRYPDQTDRFIRAVLQIPVRDHGDHELTLDYGVWVSVSEKNFEDYRAHFHDAHDETVFFGRLCNWLLGYETNPFGLHCNVYTRPDGERPRVIPHIPHRDAGHPLARDVHEGIDYREAQRRVDAALGDD